MIIFQSPSIIKNFHQFRLNCNFSAIRCKKLAEPKHGYFVKKSCDIVINSACGVRCEVGYNLVGTSIRLCQKDGSWTGVTPSCQGNCQLKT